MSGPARWVLFPATLQLYDDAERARTHAHPPSREGHRLYQVGFLDQVCLMGVQL